MAAWPVLVLAPAPLAHAGVRIGAQPVHHVDVAVDAAVEPEAQRVEHRGLDLGFAQLRSGCWAVNECRYH